MPRRRTTRRRTTTTPKPAAVAQAEPTPKPKRRAAASRRRRPPPSFKESIAEQSGSTHILIGNSLDDADILAAVSRCGYDEARLQAGLALLATMNTANHQQIAAISDAKAATAQAAAALKQLRADVQRLAKICKLAYHERPSRLGLFGLNKPIPRKTQAFLLLAERLIGYNLHDPIDSELSTYGYTREMLLEMNELRKQCEELKVKQQMVENTSHDMTRRFHDARKELHTWCMRYRMVAQLVFEDKPEQLVKIGISVVDRSAAARKGAATRAARKAQAKAAAEAETASSTAQA